VSAFSPLPNPETVLAASSERDAVASVAELDFDGNQVPLSNRKCPIGRLMKSLRDKLATVTSSPRFWTRAFHLDLH
jgi:hypothetical protein